MKNRQFLVLIIYDIVENKTRNNLVKYVEQFGIRIQKSAFECFLNQKQINKILNQAHKIINVETDSLRIYILDNSLKVHTWGRGEVKLDDCIIL